MHTTPNTTTLAEVAAAQATARIGAYDRASPARRLERLQSLYARRIDQLNLLYSLFEEGTPKLILQGESQELTLQGELIDGVCTTLAEELDKEIVRLEKAIVEAHIEVAEWTADWASVSDNQPDYTTMILALCQSTPMSVATPNVGVLPTMPPPLPAGQRLFITPPTRSTAASAF
jgi:hypothetical protein